MKKSPNEKKKNIGRSDRGGIGTVKERSQQSVPYTCTELSANQVNSFIKIFISRTEDYIHYTE